ncbi:MAG: lytic transglycosylase domain-containing protein [Deltaproteobacteria bacterium]|nr:MAG: lytic transglycosylase domain-containing protein [Deltaproteobacteria bacterium]TMB41602.1 MAG: lytic transglycosylase domain-containing protein [Deltaproteobacteria bacterium]
MVRLLLAMALYALPAAARSPLHTWTDKDGVFHVEDVPPSRARAAARKTAEAQVNVAPSRRGERWWEKRSDAPPDEIDRAAALYNVPAELVRAVIWAESAGDAAAISRAGAIGLMQLMPRTAGDMYVEDPVDPAQNIMGGTRYLRWLANQFKGDMLLTLAAYNAGPEAVRKYGGVPPFDETRQYVRRVVAYYRQLRAQTRKRVVAEAAK